MSHAEEWFLLMRNQNLQGQSFLCCLRAHKQASIAAGAAHAESTENAHISAFFR